MPECGNLVQVSAMQSKLVMLEHGNRIPFTHHNRKHKYIIKIIYLNHDFIEMIIHLSHFQQVLSILNHSYICKNLNEARTNVHHTNKESKLSPPNYFSNPIASTIFAVLKPSSL